MVLEQPTKQEKKRFENLQKQGLLPSEALKKIETERRLGIIPEDKPTLFSISKENWWFYAAMGALGVGMLYIYIKSPSPTTQSVSTQKLDTEDIQYIDFYPLELEEYY